MKEQIEGNTTFVAPTKDIVTKDMQVFYNPEMELNRSLSIELLKAVKKTDLKICLPLAGTGVRALRFLNEIPELVEHITINDINPEATKLIEKNLPSKNKTTITNTDANTLLNESYGFDYIDIDPFGSPNFLLDVAIRRIKREGILAVTATDTAAFAGTYPKTGERKYWAKTALCPQKHELSLRILIRKVLLLGMHHEKTLEPILSYHEKHYYRVFFICKKGMPKNYDQLTSCFHYNRTTGEHYVDKSQEAKEGFTTTGPLYSGLLQQDKLLEKILDQTSHKKIGKLISSLLEDNKINTIGSYDMHALCEQHKKLLKKTDEYISLIKEDAVKSAFNYKAIKTKANFKEIQKIL